MGGSVEARSVGGLGGIVRTQLVLLAVSLLGIIGGAFLIGLWAVGCAVIFDSLCAGVFALWGLDDGQPPQAVVPEYDVPTLEQVLERARRAS